MHDKLITMYWVCVSFWFSYTIISAGIWFLLIWLLGSSFMLFGRGSSSVPKRLYLSSSITCYLPLVSRNIYIYIYQIYGRLFIEFEFCFYSRVDVCNLWRKQGWRWVSLHDLQWWEHVWVPPSSVMPISVNKVSWTVNFRLSFSSQQPNKSLIRQFTCPW